MINRVVLTGRLTKDPEFRTTSTGKGVCDFTLAVDKRIKPQGDEPKADFFRCICWEKTADFVSTYVKKGHLIGVDGRLQTRRYTTNDGQNREVVEVVCDSVQQFTKEGMNTTPAPTPGPDEYDPFGS
jgi:single-strand DNA-binding protein